MNKSIQLDFSGQDVFIGLDTHLKNWRVSIIVERSPYKTFSQDPRSVVLKNYFTQNFPKANYYSAYEASFSGFNIHRELLSLGIKYIVSKLSDSTIFLKKKVILFKFQITWIFSIFQNFV